MYTARVQFKSLENSPISFSRFHDTPKESGKESDKAYEARTWRERCHYNSEGYVYIPPTAIKNCLANIAKYLSEKIEGEGNCKWTKNFKAGILVTDPIELPIIKDKIEGEWLHVPSDGQTGGTKRVMKCFPKIDKWSGEAIIYVVDEKITKDVLERYLKQAGLFVGLGRFRPASGGYYGRFDAKIVSWEKTKN
ncbi:MAG: hypothetical protein M0Q12_01135 [Synergistaceae bacterium]|jgi:hypothetical protein|nr:hypothetical protein [Synergistaceae bacterium]